MAEELICNTAGQGFTIHKVSKTPRMRSHQKKQVVSGQGLHRRSARQT